MLNPGMRRVWRDPATVQFGVDVASPVVLHGVDDTTADLLERLDGSADLASLLRATAAEGHDPERVSRLVDDLTRATAVVDAAGWPGGGPLTTAARDRLAPDLAAAALAPAAPGGPAQRCEELAATTLTVHGAGRLGAVLAALMTAAGIGGVELVDDRAVRPEDVCVGGHGPEQVGQPRTTLSSELQPWCGVRHPPAAPAPPIAVVTDAVNQRQVAQQLTATGVTHLVVSCAEGLGRVGPLVVPGRTPCLRCHDLGRIDKDPGWARVLVQLGDGAPHAACDGNLAIATAALAALHLVSHLSGGRPPSVAGSVAISLPDGTSSRRLAAFHPACGCTWPISTPQDTMAR